MDRLEPFSLNPHNNLGLPNYHGLFKLIYYTLKQCLIKFQNKHMTCARILEVCMQCTLLVSITKMQLITRSHIRTKCGNKMEPKCKLQNQNTIDDVSLPIYLQK